MKTTVTLFAATILCVADIASAQMQYNINYQDPSARTSRRDQRKSTSSTPAPGNAAAASTAGAGANASKPGARPTPASRMASTSSKATTAGKTLGKLPQAPGQPGPAKGKPGQGVAGGIGEGLKMTDVTREMVEAIRTRKVDFDDEAMADKPGVIMLNARKYVAPVDGAKAEESLARPL